MPTELGTHGWVPEILVIDYMLLDPNGTVGSRLNGNKPLIESLSPLPSLQRFALKENLKLTHPVETLSWAKETGKNQADYGCFAGGMILALMSNRPSVPIPITAQSRET